MLEPTHHPTQAAGAGSEEIHLHDYLTVLLRRRRAFFLGFWGVFLGVILFTFLMKPVYEAAATLHVRDEKVKGGGLLEDLGLSRENPIETEIEILKSRTNAEEVVRRLHLDWSIDKRSQGLEFDLLHFASTAEEPVYRILLTAPQAFELRDEDNHVLGSGRPGETLRAGGVEIHFSRISGKAGEGFRLSLLPFDETVQGVREAIRASEVGKGTNIIRLTYQHNDPSLAREVVNTLAQVYLERSVSLKTEEASRSVEFISEQLDTFRATLDSAEQNLQTFKSDTGVVKLDSEAEKLITHMTEGEKQWAAVQLRRQQAGFAIGALERALAKGESYAPSMLLDDPVVASLAEKLSELEVEKRGMLVELTEAHPKVKTLQGRIAGLHRKLLTTYQSLVEGLAKTSSSLKEELLGYETQLKKLPQAERELARLTRQATVTADIYTFLLQKHEEARIAKAATISNISVIDPAIQPERPVKPRKKVNLLLGLLVGGMFGIGLAFFLEYLDNTINDVDTAKSITGLPVLAVIPHIPRKNGEADTEEVKRSLIARQEPKSAAAEAFRSLRTALHFSSVRKEKKVLLVTSAFPGEGKTTVAANLAVIMAQTGAKVLLVGCDLRKPTLHTLFMRDRTPGLTEYLVGDAEIEAAIHTTEVEGLDFVSAGTTPPNPAELLGSERMGALVAELRERYDTILLDAPPLLAVTDATLLTALADLTVVVMEAGGVPIKAAQRVTEILRAVAAPVAGLVFNDKTGKGYEYYSYYRDRYYGKYGGAYGYGYYAAGYYEEPSPPARRPSWLTRIFKR